jgi:hypothetical protein
VIVYDFVFKSDFVCKKEVEIRLVSDDSGSSGSVSGQTAKTIEGETTSQTVSTESTVDASVGTTHDWRTIQAGAISVAKASAVTKTVAKTSDSSDSKSGTIETSGG